MKHSLYFKRVKRSCAESEAIRQGKHTLQQAKRSNQPRAKRFGVWMGDRPLVEEREENGACFREEEKAV